MRGDSVDNKKADELTIFNNWKKSQSKSDFQQLYSSMKPLIYDAAKKAAFGSNIPESAHRIYAAQAFLDSLKTFKPDSGAALQTHIYGSVHNKVKRLNYEYQNMGKIPENRAVMIGRFQNEFEHLRNDLGREPSTAEVSDHMNLPTKYVINLQKEIRKDLSMSGGLEEYAFEEGTKEEEMATYIYYELDSEEKVVYEYLTGHFGKPRLVKKNGVIDFAMIAQRMGVSESKVRAIHNRIRAKYKKAIK
jgi:DNA-directed RNA polymerase specialized sigma subunit